jgi:hypothetical protein
MHFSIVLQVATKRLKSGLVLWTVETFIHLLGRLLTVKIAVYSRLHRGWCEGPPNGQRVQDFISRNSFTKQCPDDRLHIANRAPACRDEPSQTAQVYRPGEAYFATFQ